MVRGRCLERALSWGESRLRWESIAESQLFPSPSFIKLSLELGEGRLQQPSQLTLLHSTWCELSYRYFRKLFAVMYCRQFGQFDYSSQGYDQQGGMYPGAQQQQQAGYAGTIMTPDPVNYASDATDDFENEPPLMEGERISREVRKLAITANVSLHLLSDKYNIFFV